MLINFIFKSVELVWLFLHCGTVMSTGAVNFDLRNCGHIKKKKNNNIFSG